MSEGEGGLESVSISKENIPTHFPSAHMDFNRALDLVYES